MKPGSFTGKLKDQIIMTVELAKYKSREEDDNNIDGVNKRGSNDVLRFQYDLDELESQKKYHGSGLFGGDLEGFKSKVGHLKDLGVTSIVVYPFLKSDQDDIVGSLPTGYGIVDWQKIDVNFRRPGEPEDEYSAFTELVEELHSTKDGQPKLNVILDVAMTLCGNECPWTNPLTAFDHMDKVRRFNPDDFSVNLSSVINNANSGAEKWKTYTIYEVFDIRKYFNEDVFSHNTNRSDGNIGGTGYSYPSEGIGNATAEVVFGTVLTKYRIGSKLDEDNNAIKGQLKDIAIDIPAAKYAFLGLAASSTSGDSRVQFKVEYRDGSFDVTDCTVPVWDPENEPAKYLYKFNHRHSVRGEEDSTPVYMYSIHLNVDPTKEVKAIHMVGSSQMENVHVFAASGVPVTYPVKVDLSSYYNLDIISSDSNKGDGDLDMLFPDSKKDGERGLKSFLYGDFGFGYGKAVNFAVGPVADGRENAVRCQGQEIKIPGIRTHYFFMAAFSAAEIGKKATFKVKFEDGTEKDATFDVKSWTDSASQDDVVVHQSDRCYSMVDNQWVEDDMKLSIWGYTIDLQDESSSWNRKVVSITLPEDEDIILVALNPFVCLDVNWGLTVLGSIESMEDNKEYYDYFFKNVICFWLDKADFDGYRVDSVQNELPELWAKLIEDFKAKYPGKIVLGEAGIDPSGPLSWQMEEEQYINSAGGINFDSIYDFGLTDKLKKIFALDMPANGKGSNLFKASIEYDKKYEKPWHLMFSFDNYENYSFLAEVDKNVDENGDKRYPEYADKLKKIRMAAAMIMTMNRIPLMFSGNEYLLDYGGHTPVGTNFRKPGFLFTDEVQKNPVYQDNYKYIRALIEMRKTNPALRSEERMDEEIWFVKGETLFGFVRQEKAEPSIITIFNNSSKKTGSFEAKLPVGVTGDYNWNFVMKDSSGEYGDHDETVSWPAPDTIKIQSMEPWEVKIIKINK